MASYDEMVYKDMELMRIIQYQIYSTSWLQDLFTKCVSKNPLKDIVLVLWFFFVFGLFEIGVKHFWVVMINFCAVIRKNLY
jgi:hypothetical protein